MAPYAEDEDGAVLLTGSLIKDEDDAELHADDRDVVFSIGDGAVVLTGRPTEDRDSVELQTGCRDVVFAVLEKGAILEMGVVLLTSSLADEVARMKITPGRMPAVPARKESPNEPPITCSAHAVMPPARSDASGRCFVCILKEESEREKGRERD